MSENLSAILTLDNMNNILSLMPKCPFCGAYPKSGMGYNFGKVYCSNDECKISDVYFYPGQWNRRV